MIPPTTSLTHYTDQSISTIHHALRAPRRRLAVAIVARRWIITDGSKNERQLVRSQDETISVRDLAREIVAIEEGIPADNVAGENYHAVYTALTQTHLPYLDDVGAIKYSPDRKTIRPDNNLTALTMVSVTTSPVAQILFNNSAAVLYDRSQNPEDSLSDL